MPFQKGNQASKGHGRPRKESVKTIWLLQSLAENGVDLQSLLAKSIIKAEHGDKAALDLAHLLIKMLPLVSNMPKADTMVAQIETLVINKYDAAKPVALPSVDTTLVDSSNESST